MSFTDIKTKNQGFTIVELLIVVVVIAILAAITIVSYNGITARANTSKAQSNAASVQKKAEAFYADNASANPLNAGNGAYPATAAIFNALPASAIGGLPTGVKTQSRTTATAAATTGNATTFSTAVTDTGAPTATNGGSVVQYVACAPTANATTADGFFIAYWDYTISNYKWVAGGNYASLPSNGTQPTDTNCAASGRVMSTL